MCPYHNVIKSLHTYLYERSCPKHSLLSGWPWTIYMAWLMGIFLPQTCRQCLHHVCKMFAVFAGNCWQIDICPKQKAAVILGISLNNILFVRFLKHDSFSFGTRTIKLKNLMWEKGMGCILLVQIVLYRVCYNATRQYFIKQSYWIHMEWCAVIFYHMFINMCMYNADRNAFSLKHLI